MSQPVADIDVVAYLSSKGKHGRRAKDSEVAYPCFFTCAEPADSRKRKLYINTETGMYHCLAGETEVVTADGIFSIEKLAGGCATLLDGNGQWVESEVRSFGVQPLVELVLQRSKITQSIFVTAEHRWFVRGAERTTTDLTAGDVLDGVVAQREDLVASDAGRAHGIVYGDGTTHFVNLWGGKRALAEYVPGSSRKELQLGALRGVRVNGTPNAWKRLPTLAETDEYLLGWVQGYIATDGTVTKSGNVSIDSVDSASLMRVQEVAQRLGCIVSPIRTYQHKGKYRPEGHRMFRITFQRATFRAEWLLRQEHRLKYGQDSGRPRIGWRVVEVRPSDRFEEVFCAIVPTTESFALAHNLLTGNCKVCLVEGGTFLLQKNFGDDPKVTALPGQDPFTRRQLLRVAQGVGAEMLKNNDDILLYLLTAEQTPFGWGRGLSAETVIERGLGFAGNGWSLTECLGDGFHAEDIRNSGLVYRDGHLAGKAFFTNHLLIPYLTRGGPAMIRGRALDPHAKAKYLNGPDQDHMLYSADDLDDCEDAIITEGEFDCFDGRTEVLTASGWVRLDAYTDGAVVQYEEGGALSLVAPLAYTSKHAERTVRIASSRNGGIDLRVTPQHRMVSVLADGSGLQIHAAEDRPSARRHVPRVGLLDGPGVAYSNDEVALLLAISADASIDFRKGDGAQYVRFGFSKQRKIDRLRKLLASLGIEHSDEPIGCDVRSICFRVPNYLTAFRELPNEWLTQLSLAQREHVLDEIVHWDGNSVSDRDQHEFSSKLAHNAEWVQTLAHTCGQVATVMRRSNDLGDWRKVSLLHSKRSTSWQSLTIEEAGPAQVYCVQVPSGMLLVRRAGQVTVSGNCMILSQTLMQSPEDRIRAFGVVGIAGTGAIPKHIESYFAHVKRIHIALDPDDPGKRAAIKLKEMFGTRARIVELPEGEPKCDWTDFIARRHATWRDCMDLIGHASGKRVFSIREAGSAWRTRRELSAGIKTGIKELDQVILPGLLPGQVTVILAKTGVGKTLLLCNFAYNMKQHKILFISLEMTREEVYERLRKIYLFWNPHHSDENLEFALRNIMICDENRLTNQDFATLIEEFVVETGCRPEMVFVDYLGYFARSQPGTGNYEKVTNAIMQLKAESKGGANQDPTKRFHIMTPAQVNRGPKEGRPIDLDDARDSGAIEETADFLLAAYKPDDALSIENNSQPSGRLVLDTLKSRHGGKGRKFPLILDSLTLAIVEANSSKALEATEHNRMEWRGDTWHDLRREQTKPEQRMLSIAQ